MDYDSVVYFFGGLSHLNFSLTSIIYVKTCVSCFIYFGTFKKYSCPEHAWNICHWMFKQSTTNQSLFIIIEKITLQTNNHFLQYLSVDKRKTSGFDNLESNETPYGCNDKIDGICMTCYHLYKSSYFQNVIICSNYIWKPLLQTPI